MTQTQYLGDQPVDSKTAHRLATSLIRQTYGTIPHAREPKKEGDAWTVIVDVNYPRVIFDEATGIRKRVRFMKFESLGEIKIDANTGMVLDKPTFYSVQHGIGERLSSIRQTVERALVKVGAKNFSQLPLPSHFTSPIIDILATLLVSRKATMEFEEEALSQYDYQKYSDYAKGLSEIGLVNYAEGGPLTPGPILIEIEASERAGKTLHEKLSSALAYFFEEGYQNLEMVGRVLGPYLHISGALYELTYEYQELSWVRTGTIQNWVADAYPALRKKMIQYPRYLIQLETVGLVESEIKGGERMWRGTSDIFGRMLAEEDIFSPLRDFGL